jgi:ubiquinol-cytochrome c reductase cytochrome b subunit
VRADRRRPRSFSETASEYLRERTAPGRAFTTFRAELRTRVIPVHWTNFLGVITIASIAVLFVTGIMLMFVYVPSSGPVVYKGDFAPLVGIEVSRAFDSVMRLSFDVPGGLVVRQLHHWAALLVPASIMLQLLVSFFTGAFRRPRRGSWLALFLLLIAVLAGGWSGYALPDDALSGTGLRIVHGIVHSIPFVGTWIATFLFGGEFPSTIIENLNLIHVAVVPAVTVLLIALRARWAFKNKPPQFAAGGREEGNVVGIPMLPHAAVRSGGFFAVVVGVLVLMASAVQISPLWTYGPADPGTVSAGSQPDWYTGFLDGALRLVPPGWEFVLFDRTVTLALLVPLVVIGVFLLVVAVYPFLEGWISKDKTDHHILDRPRNTATRTGIGSGSQRVPM